MIADKLAQMFKDYGFEYKRWGNSSTKRIYLTFHKISEIIIDDGNSIVQLYPRGTALTFDFRYMSGSTKVIIDIDFVGRVIVDFKDINILQNRNGIHISSESGKPSIFLEIARGDAGWKGI